MSIYSECGHEYHGNHCAKCAREAGAQQERAKIVAWMREDDGYMLAGDISYRRDLAAEIENKEHLK
jgi:hypothetical protein